MDRLLFTLFMLFSLQVLLISQEQKTIHIGHGTAIAIFRTNDEIAIAADSRMTYTDLGSTGKEEISYDDTFCKIKTYNNIIFSAAEFGFMRETGYNIFEIADKYLSGAQNFEEKFNLLDKEIIKKLRQSMSYLKIKLPHNKKAVFLVDMAFTGIWKNKLRIWRKTIVVDSTGSYKIHIAVPSTKEEDFSVKCFMGVLKANGDATTIDPKFISLENNPVEYVKAVLEIGKTLPGVGGDIDILKITKTGHEWIQVKNNCN